MNRYEVTATAREIADNYDDAKKNFQEIGTCILIGWIIKPKTVIDEVEKNGEKMGRKRLYIVMIKYIALIMLVILFLKSISIMATSGSR